MSRGTVLTALLPVRDVHDAVTAFELRTHPLPGFEPENLDAEARAVLTHLQRSTLLRMVRGRPLHVPVTPALVRGGAITGFASADVVFFLAMAALDDPETVRALERQTAAGFRFGFVGDALRETLPQGLLGAPVAFDIGALHGLALSNTVQRLLECGARPIARQVDDRATRERLRSSGVQLFAGRPLPGGRGTAPDTRARALRALTVLCRLSDGRPLDASLDRCIADDPLASELLLRAAASAADGTARPTSLTFAFTLLGREAMLQRLTVAAAFLLGDAAQDASLAATALRRARAVERLGGALDRSVHPRTRTLAGILSVADVALGLLPTSLADAIEAPAALRDAMIARSSALGALLDVVDAHEAGWWDDMFARCRSVGLGPAVVGEAWLEGWQFARMEEGARAAGDA